MLSQCLSEDPSIQARVNALQNKGLITEPELIIGPTGAAIGDVLRGARIKEVYKVLAITGLSYNDEDPSLSGFRPSRLTQRNHGKDKVSSTASHPCGGYSAFIVHGAKEVPSKTLESNPFKAYEVARDNGGAFLPPEIFLALQIKRKLMEMEACDTTYATWLDGYREVEVRMLNGATEVRQCVLVGSMRSSRELRLNFAQKQPSGEILLPEGEIGVRHGVEIKPPQGINEKLRALIAKFSLKGKDGTPHREIK